MARALTQLNPGSSHLTLFRVVLTILFTLFLLPIQIGGISVNYSFLFLPLGYLLFTGHVKSPPRSFTPIIAFYVLIFIAASVYQLQYLGEGLRRIISFTLFMSAFSYTFVKIDKDMVVSFKAAVVLISLLLSLNAMYVFFVSSGSSTLGFEARDLVGSNRVGFIYLVAFWLVYLHKSSERLFAVLKYPILIILLGGLLLTFSRSSIVGLLASFGLFTLAGCLKWCKQPSLKSVGKAVSTVILLGGIFALLYTTIPLAFAFFEERIFSYISDSITMRQDLGDMYSSGGTRIYLLRRISEFVYANPWTGSGYLGVWILPGLGGDFVGSAHNQYADVLFRTGFIGLFVYGYLLLLLLIFLYKNERSLFWGFVAVLMYGIFNETFKESQGSFVLAFSIGMLAQSLRESRSSAQSTSVPVVRQN